MDRRWIRGQCIGKGSFGAVNLAVETSTCRFFAVKSVNFNFSPPHAAVALENEIRVLRSLDSPNIISYLGDDFTEEPFSDESCRNLHLEYLPGGNLADAAASGKICERRVRDYTRSIARGLQYLHSTAGFVHGDVKGRNVLLGSSIGVAKLADFGSARKISGAEEEYVRGTPLWMAPEVARGEAPTPASDVWSLGCTVIEISGGSLSPWGNTWAGAALEMHRIGFTDASPEFPSSLSEIGHDFLSNCLSRDPGKRWSCDELLQHPFLSDAAAITWPSPRSILDWGEVELDFDGETSSVWQRIRDLETSAAANWDDAGWITVRRSSAETGEEEQGFSGQYLENRGDDTAAAGVGVSGASGVGLSSGGMECGGDLYAGGRMRTSDIFFVLIACSQILVNSLSLPALLFLLHVTCFLPIAIFL